MIDLQHTYWKIKSTMVELTGKMLIIKPNGVLSIDKKVVGLITITSDKITMELNGGHFKGVIIENHIFGEILYQDKKSVIEFDCHSFDSSNEYMSKLQNDEYKNYDEYILICELFEVLKDYKLEFSKRTRISKKTLKKWIKQFDISDRVAILSTLLNKLSRNYLSRTDAKFYISKLIDRLQNDLCFENPYSLLEKTIFIFNEKDVKIMKPLVHEVLKEKFNFKPNNKKIKKGIVIYIADYQEEELLLNSQINLNVKKINNEIFINDDCELILFLLNEKKNKEFIYLIDYSHSNSIINKSLIYTIRENCFINTNLNSEKIDSSQKITSYIDLKSKEKMRIFKQEELTKQNLLINYEIAINAFLKKEKMLSNQVAKNFEKIDFKSVSDKFENFNMNWKSVPENSLLLFANSNSEYKSLSPQIPQTHFFQFLS